ncbi:phosphatidylethanolamine-binding protein [Holotrichia oblita]|uniref:Phosphatidylethanolamine-binding protein n=1 Tax=Holotrichia oblita TaxID=644536 RepID=A0ACB9TYI2_HOLOL|nr:phosphatidylethanolamine-binding protein [Holotrichia oblita]
MGIRSSLPEAKEKPIVSYESDDKSLWTLILTNPDGHLTKQNSNTSIGLSVSPKGTGYHRFIFVLYKQDKKIDFASLKREGKCANLEERTFSTLDFYRERQDFMTPAGLAFFQSNWESSLTEFYHNVLSTIKKKINFSSDK